MDQGFIYLNLERFEVKSFGCVENTSSKQTGVALALEVALCLEVYLGISQQSEKVCASQFSSSFVGA